MDCRRDVPVMTRKHRSIAAISISIEEMSLDIVILAIVQEPGWLGCIQEGALYLLGVMR